jgi:osmotically-inducible protein OsmY
VKYLICLLEVHQILRKQERQVKHAAIKWSTLLGVSALAVVGVAGCQDKNNDDVPDSPATAPQINKAVNKGVAAVENAATKTADAAKDVAANGVTTGKIKAAYAKNDSIKALDINVTTDSSKKIVMLDGTVQNAAQKKMAKKLAKQNAPAGFKIMNNLKVGGGASPMMNKGVGNKGAGNKGARKPMAKPAPKKAP